MNDRHQSGFRKLNLNKFNELGLAWNFNISEIEIGTKKSNKDTVTVIDQNGSKERDFLIADDSENYDKLKKILIIEIMSNNIEQSRTKSTKDEKLILST
ncbi:hypothetical protein BpHYR1_026553 [Brachionus plicatilis]|uniref:Uncharacterized protein n=1 Tax=Brachionus plicatilis TaxID=10195 RepID=A0A3M7SCD8_BRAPC|nr:hypothetical protein BpHYR1_026553 [Brachionus plicatilis]